MLMEGTLCLIFAGPGRVGAQSGLGPGPGWGPYGPIWALMFFVKNVTFRVQTAPFDKITIDFWRSRRRLYIPNLLKTVSYQPHNFSTAMLESFNDDNNKRYRTIWKAASSLAYRPSEWAVHASAPSCDALDIRAQHFNEVNCIMCPHHS